MKDETGDEHATATNPTRRQALLLLGGIGTGIFAFLVGGTDLWDGYGFDSYGRGGFGT